MLPVPVNVVPTVCVILYDNLQVSEREPFEI